MATSNLHHIRKSVHLWCFIAFVVLPFLNVMRFDIPHQRFYFAGFELWINEFAIIFFALMFLMFVVVASSVFYGRVYCGYLCPQMIFSEASVALENWLKRRAAKLGLSKLAARAAFYAVLAVASVFLAFVFISYFVEPRDLIQRLVRLDLRTAAGISGAAVTVLTFLDFTLVRLKFCTTICPYGYLQGVLGDDHTLLVHYRDQGHQCIECKKCVRVCGMGIDIRDTPYAIECVHCGECIDACNEILGKLKKPGLIHYTWGEKGEPLGQNVGPWYRRVGIRDAKRVIVLLIALCYACGLGTALAMRSAVLVRVSPVRAKLYSIGDDGRVYNRFRYTIANRGKANAFVVFSVDQLPGAKLSLSPNPVPVKPGDSLAAEFEISTPVRHTGVEVTHFRIITNSEAFPMTFLTPPERNANP